MKLIGRKNKGVVRTKPGSSDGVDVTTLTDENDLPPVDANRPDVVDAVHSATSTSEIIDAYELRIEELGQLMLKQGRHLDELTNRSLRLSTENNMLREKVFSGLENLTAKRSGKSLHTKLPFDCMIRLHEKNQDDNTNRVKKDKEDNDLLHQQIELLIDELTHSNKKISEMDMTIASLEKELKNSSEHSSQLMAEKAVLKKNILEKNSEIEVLKSDVKTMNKLRSQLASKSEHLLSEREELKEEVVVLGTQVKHSSSQIESFHNQLATRQSEVGKLMEQCHSQERENHVAKREARVIQEKATKLQEDLNREKLRNEQLESALKEARNQIDDSRVSDKCNAATIESLRSEIKEISKTHNETLSGFAKAQNKVLSAINQQHSSRVNALEKTVANLQRVNSTLENERSRFLREKQSSDQRYHASELLCHNKDNEQKCQIQLLLDRATNAEVQLDTSLSAQQDLKREVVSLEANLLEMQCTMKEMKGKHDKTSEQQKKELLNARQENDSLSNQISIIQDQLESTLVECRKEMEKIKCETDRKIREAEVEVEAIKVSKSSDQLIAIESRTALDKAVEIHQTLIEQMKSEAKDMRMELEKVISDERSVNQQLMAKIQEQNQAMHSLTWDKHQSKLQIKGLIDKNTELESIVATGEVKLRNLGRQLTKSVEEQERCIRAEAELKTLRIELSKIRSNRGA